jgi:hypothetical protein
VVVHEFLDGNVGVSFNGVLLARYNRQGELLTSSTAKKAAA